MNVVVGNLGTLKHADFDLGDLTIICGDNNTGKTYASYALYGFIDFWKRGFTLNIDRASLDKLFSIGKVLLPIEYYNNNKRKEVELAAERYSKVLSKVFASKDSLFSNSFFKITIPQGVIPHLNNSYKALFGSADKNIMSISSFSDKELEVSLLMDKISEGDLPPKHIIADIISDSLKHILYSLDFPNTFIISSERTGVAIFRKELDLTRNKLIDIISEKKTKIKPFSLLSKFTSDYALPIKDNVEFTRQLEDICKKESVLHKDIPDIMNDYHNIAGGEYRVIRNELYFIPKEQRNIRLSMTESSSSVRSLLILGFYLQHEADKGDLLIIDEPELNLHPKKQRYLTRLFVRLVNYGIKVFITTHSDYIVKELNALIMLNNRKTQQHIIMEREHIKQDELLNSQKVKLYMSGKNPTLLEGNSRKVNCNTLTKAPIDEMYGIEVKTFNETINDMNRIEEELMFKCEEEE